jgi:hypothetical protein
MGLLSVAFALQGHAQQRVNVGVVTKYTGAPASLDERRDSELYLSTLETQIAGESIRLNNVNYLDRSSVREVFQELHLSSDAAFDQSSGGLRGLLGRLDILIVIDASSPAVARLRAIETQTGAVRGLATCKRSRSLFGNASDGEQNCVQDFVAQVEPSIRATLSRKQKLNAEQLADLQRQVDDRVSQRKAADAAQQLAMRQEAQAQRDATEQRQAAAKEAQAQAEKQQKQRQDIQSQLVALQPDLEDAMSRLSSTNAFWNQMRREMAGRGQSLRSEIQTGLIGANANGSRCQTLFNTSQPATLKACTGELNHRLVELESYK